MSILRIKVFKFRESASGFIMFLGANLANNTRRNLLDLEKKNGKIGEKENKETENKEKWIEKWGENIWKTNNIVTNKLPERQRTAMPRAPAIQ